MSALLLAVIQYVIYQRHLCKKDRTGQTMGVNCFCITNVVVGFVWFIVVGKMKFKLLKALLQRQIYREISIFQSFFHLHWRCGRVNHFSKGIAGEGMHGINCAVTAFI